MSDRIVSADEAREMLRRGVGRHTHNRDGDECEMCEAEATRKDALAYHADALARTVVALHAEVERATVRCNALREDLANAEHERDEARATRDAAEAEFVDVIVRVWRAATGDTHEGPASVEALLDAVAGLRESVDGRTTPPTDEELRAHDGTWLVQWGENSYCFGVGIETLREMRAREWGAAIRWVPYRNGRPCAWPVVGGAR